LSGYRVYQGLGYSSFVLDWSGVLSPYPRTPFLDNFGQLLIPQDQFLHGCQLLFSSEPQSRKKISDASGKSVTHYLARVLIRYGLQEPSTDSRIDPVGLRQRPFAPSFDLVHR
jgi:hypothetical protein